MSGSNPVVPPQSGKPIGVELANVSNWSNEAIIGLVFGLFAVLVTLVSMMKYLLRRKLPDISSIMKRGWRRRKAESIGNMASFDQRSSLMF